MKICRSMLFVSVLVVGLLWGWGAWHSVAQGTASVSPDPVGMQLGTASEKTLTAVEPLSDTEVYTAYLPLALNAFGDPLNLEGTFFDDFSDPGSGWKVAENDIAKAAYVDGEYELTVKDPDGYVVVTSPFGRFRDYVLEVDVYQVSEWAAYSLVFDYNDEDGYYVFSIVPDLDSYSISQFSYGSYDFIHSGYYPSAYQENPGAVML